MNDNETWVEGVCETYGCHNLPAKGQLRCEACLEGNFPRRKERRGLKQSLQSGEYQQGSGTALDRR